MSKQKKFLVYLAGPMSGCNSDQRCRWRNNLKKSQYSKHFTFVDPIELKLRWPKLMTPRQIIEADLQTIKQADGLLVNMWRESIGSAVGMVHAHREGHPVVIANPNHLDNPILAFYSDAVTDTPLKAANRLLDLLRATTWDVIKRGSSQEPFKRQKLIASIREACRHVQCDDIFVPRIVLPKIIERLKETRKIAHKLTTSDIGNAVVTTFQSFEMDPAYVKTVRGVLAEWQDASIRKKGHVLRPQSSAVSHFGMNVKVASSRSHATIWGKTVNQLEDIPSKDARRVFQTIWATAPGITRINLGPFNDKESRRASGAFIESSMTPFLIEGKLYDRGKKGTMQTFQIHVQFDEEKERMANDIKASLKRENCWLD